MFWNFSSATTKPQVLLFILNYKKFSSTFFIINDKSFVYFINRFSNFVFKYKKTPILFSSFRKIQNSPLDVNTNVANNVILWKYEGTKYFKNLGIFGFFQFIVLSGFSYSVFHLIPSKNDDEKLLEYLKKAIISITLVVVPILAGMLDSILFIFFKPTK